MTKRAVIITTSFIVILLMTITMLFGVVFRVRTIEFKYGEEFQYKAQINEILTASKLKKNTSIFDINREEITKNIETAFPYARVDGINLVSATKLKVTLSNRAPLYYFTENETCFVLDEDCKVLEKISVQEYNNRSLKYILLNNVFSAGESVEAGQFLTNKYSALCKDLYKALYSNAMIEKEQTDEIFEAQYLNRDEMCEFIDSIRFTQSYELNGKVDKLIMTTSSGVEMVIIHPQNQFNLKINMAFSAFRSLQQTDRLEGSSLTQSGSINVIYNYDTENNQSIICEYRA